jgi:hypothetical protein
VCFLCVFETAVAVALLLCVFVCERERVCVFCVSGFVVT